METSCSQEEMEGRSFMGSVSVLTAPLAATAVIKSVTVLPRRWVEVLERGPQENPARISEINLETV